LRPFAFLERFEDVSEGAGELGAGQRGGVAVGRRVDHRHVVVATDRLGGSNAVHRSFEQDVHQHEVRAEPAGQRDRLIATRGSPGDLIAQPAQLLSQVHRDDALVFNDENLNLVHGVVAPKLTENAVPSPLWTSTAA